MPKQGKAAKKARCAASWARGKKNTEARVAAQEKRAAANRTRRANGEPTPWEESKAKRREARKGKQPKKVKA